MPAVQLAAVVISALITLHMAVYGTVWDMLLFASLTCIALSNLDGDDHA